MSDWLMKTIRAEARRLLELAADDGELRADLRALAGEILAATEVTTSDASAHHAAASVPADDSSNPADEPLRELTLGHPQPAPPGATNLSAQSIRSEAVADDLARLEARCRGKGAIARGVAESEQALREGASVHGTPAPHDHELTAWAQTLRDSFYWKNSKLASGSTDVSVLDELAGCFETLAEGLALVQQSRNRGKSFEQALKYLAEAQSAVRRGLQRLEIGDDPDQESVYEWIRSTSARRRVYLGRHMRADDLADPAAWSSLLTRIEEARSSGQRTPLELSGMDQVRRLSTRIARRTDVEHDWPEIVENVARLVDHGMPPSSRELRELMLPIIDDAPTEVRDPPRGFCLVLREIDRYLATRSPEVQASFPHEPAIEVKEVADLLAGKTVVLIGGIHRREAQQALKKAFHLASLVWVETKEHQSVETFEPMIVRPEVALVLLAIRWSSHGFGEVRHLCERHGKPLVRLPGGYSPNQVATQILAQASEHLHGAQESTTGP